MLLVLSSCVIITIIQLVVLGFTITILPSLFGRILYQMRPLGFEKEFKVYVICEIIGVAFTAVVSMFSHRYSVLQIGLMLLFSAVVLLIERVDYTVAFYPVFDYIPENEDPEDD